MFFKKSSFFLFGLMSASFAYSQVPVVDPQFLQIEQLAAEATLSDLIITNQIGQCLTDVSEEAHSTRDLSWNTCYYGKSEQMWRIKNVINNKVTVAGDSLFNGANPLMIYRLNRNNNYKIIGLNAASQLILTAELKKFSEVQWYMKNSLYRFGSFYHVDAAAKTIYNTFNQTRKNVQYCFDNKTTSVGLAEVDNSGFSEMLVSVKNNCADLFIYKYSPKPKN